MTGALAQGIRSMTTQGHLHPAQPLLRRAAALAQSPSTRYSAGLLVLSAAYYGSAKIGQTVQLHSFGGRDLAAGSASRPLPLGTPLVARGIPW
jgi:hypothetical protein